MATKNRYDNLFIFSLLLSVVVGSRMGKNQDPGYGINIPDPGN
jgi:hypothetical protein